MENEEKIFISQRIVGLDKWVIIEEDENSIWAFLMDKNCERIEFDGFLCSVKQPVESFKNLDFQSEGKPPPLIKKFANRYSYIRQIKSDQVRIESDKANQLVDVKINEELYLRMDLKEKKSYSKALSADCSYGMTLNENLDTSPNES